MTFDNASGIDVCAYADVRAAGGVDVADDDDWNCVYLDRKFSSFSLAPLVLAVDDKVDAVVFC